MKTLLHILYFTGLLWLINLMSELPYGSWIVIVINLIAYWKLTSFK